MKKQNKRSLAAMLALAMTASSLVGCGVQQEVSETSSDSMESTTKQDSTSSAADEVQETVTIKWHRTNWHANEDEKKVEAAINEYIEPLIGVNVDILTDSDTDLKLTLAAGGDIDLFWTASWSGGPGYISGNAAYNIADLLPQYEGLYNSMPESIWESITTTDGAIYYIPNYKESALGYNVCITKEAIDKYGWDVSSIKTLEDLTPLLEEAYADGMDNPMYYFTLQNQSGVKDFDFIKPYIGLRRDGSNEVVNIIETEEYAEYVNLMYSWNQAGYFGTFGDDLPYATGIEEGRTCMFIYTTVPDNDVAASVAAGKEVVSIDLTGNYIYSDSAIGSAYMINAKSEKVDACMKFLEMLSTDQTLADLACFGIEGEHYNRTADGRVELISDKYKYNGVWIVCNVMAPSLQVGESDDKKEQYASFNESAQLTQITGFWLDESSISAEITAIQSVNDEYRYLLEQGNLDPVESLPKYRDALKAAGIDKVIAEIQAQYDAWRQ